METSALLFENKTVAGFHLGEMMAALMRLTQEGRLRPIVGQSFPLERAAEAHRRLGARETFGKLLLLPQLPGE